MGPLPSEAQASANEVLNNEDDIQSQAAHTPEIHEPLANEVFNNEDNIQSHTDGYDVEKSSIGSQKSYDSEAWADGNGSDFSVGDGEDSNDSVDDIDYDY
jgi:hypothetical protein